LQSEPLMNPGEPVPTPLDRSVLARTAAGTGWIVGWRMASRLLGVVSTLILVRLLSPADFGLVALGTTFTVAVDTFSALGVEDALVREPAPSAATYDTAFTLTLLRALLTALLIAAAAVPVAGFFNEPRLANVLWALSAGMAISGAASVGTVYFRRDMAFEKEFVLQILPRLISVSVTIAAALMWRSYWALIAGILAGRALRTGFGYLMHGWRPRLTLAAWHGLIGFSMWSWAVSIVQLLRDRVDIFVVGRVMSPAAVGVYAIGEEMAALPTTEVVLPLCRACFSAFAAAGRTGAGTSEAFMRPVATTFLITLPAGLGVSLVADPLVSLVFGEKWLVAIPVVQILGVVGAFMVFGLVASTLLAAFAMLRQVFVVTLACLVLRLAVLLLLVGHYGMLGAAIGASAGILLEHMLALVLVFRRFGLSVVELARRVWRTVAAACLMAVVLVSCGLGWTRVEGDAAAVAVALSSAVVVGAVAYATSLIGVWWLSGRPAGAEADLLALAVRLVHGVRRRRPPASLEQATLQNTGG